MLSIEKAKQSLQEVAKREGVPLETVVRNIETGIGQAIEDCRRRGDQRALEIWKQIPSVGEVPTPFELVAYLGQLSGLEFALLNGDMD